MRKLLDFYNKNEIKFKLTAIIISALSVILSLILKYNNLMYKFIIDPAWIAIILCGLKIIIGAIIGIIRDHDITADLLVSLAIIGSLILQEYFAAGEVALIMEIGSLLEDFTASRAQKGIQKLIKISPKKATIIKDDKRMIASIDEVKENDILEVIAGENIPVDGVIISGETSIDQSNMTGESVPIYKTINDSVISGTMNIDGAIIIKASKSARNSSLQRMIKLASSADAQKAKIVRKANKWAAYLVIISLMTSLIVGLIIGLINNDFWIGFKRAVTILVVFCPCAFVLATPTAISAGIGNASKNGILVQSGEALERIADSNIVIFDKTGTLSKGKLSISKIEVINERFNEKSLIRIAASGEIFSSHPLAKTIVDANKEPLLEITDHKTIPGKGISFKISNDLYFVGKINDEDNKINSTIIGIFLNNNLIGKIYFNDELKDNAKEIIEILHKKKRKVIMLTGDNVIVAKNYAENLNIDDYKANCSPMDKMEYIKKLEKDGNKVAMFGDGVNDSLALRTAYAGIAMGGIGSDVAIESSDAVIIKDNLDAIPYLFNISKKTQNRITINLLISLFLNFIAITLSIVGILNTVTGALFHNCGSVAVVISAFLLLFYKQKKYE
jgi:heavy metal translocating P-type ATPase